MLLLTPLLVLALLAQDTPASEPAATTRVERVAEVPTDGLLTALDFDANGRVGLAVGGHREEDPALVLRTTDAGRTWARVPCEVTGRLYDVDFGSEGLALAVGLRGTILRSTDRGAHWSSVHRGEEWWAGVAFATPSQVWAVGARGSDAALLKSEDAGETWSTGPSLPANCARASLRAIAFRDAQLGCIVGTDGTLLMTRDAGASWTSLPVGDGYLRGIAFQSAKSIWVAGGPGVVLNSLDEGRTWRRIPFEGDEKLNSIRFADETLGWMTSMQGDLFETRDGGGSWRSIFRLANTHLTGLRIVGAEGGGLVVGDGGTVLRFE